MQVVVKNGNVERAMRTLKKKLQKEGLLKELKQKQYFEKPSAKRKRKKAEGIKRYQRQWRCIQLRQPRDSDMHRRVRQ
jgi:small subunit ribosomal protein S21